MTVLLGPILALLVVMFGNLMVDIAGASNARVRAQTAADAAALAAIAESGPYGSGAHEATARRYAALNGAVLLGCECSAGALSVQIRVELDGVEAEARAAYDPTRLGPAAPPAMTGLDPRMAEAVATLLATTSGKVHVVSGYRSRERQEMLWSQALAKYGSAEAADDWVAPPGSSMHERGLAVDLGGDLRLAAAKVLELGLPLHAPLSNEPWHFELVGSR